MHIHLSILGDGIEDDGCWKENSSSSSSHLSIWLADKNCWSCYSVLLPDNIYPMIVNKAKKGAQSRRVVVFGPPHSNQMKGTKRKKSKMEPGRVSVENDSRKERGEIYIFREKKRERERENIGKEWLVRHALLVYTGQQQYFPLPSFTASFLLVPDATNDGRTTDSPVHLIIQILVKKPKRRAGSDRTDGLALFPFFWSARLLIILNSLIVACWPPSQQLTTRSLVGPKEKTHLVRWCWPGCRSREDINVAHTLPDKERS